MDAKTQTPGEKIRAARKNLGYTLEDAAKATGMSLVTISRLENGHNRPNKKSAEKLKKGLGVNLLDTDLFRGPNASSDLDRRVTDLELQMDTIVEDVLHRLDTLEADPVRDPAAARALLVRIAEMHPDQIKEWVATLPAPAIAASRAKATKPKRRQPQPA